MTSANVCLIVDVSDLSRDGLSIPVEYTLQSASASHTEPLSGLFLSCYESDIVASPEAALEDMKSTFSGEDGDIWPEASPLIFKGDFLAGAILTVYKAPWAATPTCPFIINLMVDPGYRRKGLATLLLRQTAAVVAVDGATHMALRVLADNSSAVSLYRSLGFEAWDGKLYAPL